MLNITVETLMVPVKKYPHVPDTLTLAEAITAWRRWQIETPDGKMSLPRTMLVFNENLQLSGFLRRRDILRGLEPSFLGQKRGAFRQAHFPVAVDDNVAELSFEKIAEGMRRRSQRLVREFTIPIHATINYDDHVVKAISLLVSHDVSALAVMKEGKVIGVLRTVDVMYAVARALGIEDTAEGP